VAALGEIAFTRMRLYLGGSEGSARSGREKQGRWWGDQPLVTERGGNALSHVIKTISEILAESVGINT